jgi:hypothetical protein
VVCGVWCVFRVLIPLRGSWMEHESTMEGKWNNLLTPNPQRKSGDTLVPNFSLSSLPLEIAEIEKLDPNMTWRAYISDRYFLHVVLSGIVTPKFEIRQWLQHLSAQIYKKLVANNPVNAIQCGHSTFIINFENYIPYVLHQQPVVVRSKRYNYSTLCFVIGVTLSIEKTQQINWDAFSRQRISR